MRPAIFYPVLLVAALPAALPVLADDPYNIQIQNCFYNQEIQEFAAAKDVQGTDSTQYPGSIDSKLDIDYKTSGQVHCNDSDNAGACYIKVHGSDNWHLISHHSVTFYSSNKYNQGMIDTSCTEQN